MGLENIRSYPQLKKKKNGYGYTAWRQTLTDKILRVTIVQRTFHTTENEHNHGNQNLHRHAWIKLVMLTSSVPTIHPISISLARLLQVAWHVFPSPYYIPEWLSALLPLLSKLFQAFVSELSHLNLFHVFSRLQCHLFPLSKILHESYFWRGCYLAFTLHSWVALLVSALFPILTEEWQSLQSCGEYKILNKSQSFARA